MNPIGKRRTSGSHRQCGAAALALGAALVFAPCAQAQDGAARILKAMSDYVTSKNNITATYDSDIEVITVDLQKLQFTSSGQLSLSRPDKLRASRTGGYADVEFVFDGKTFTVHDRDGIRGRQVHLAERRRVQFRHSLDDDTG